MEDAPSRKRSCGTAIACDDRSIEPPNKIPHRTKSVVHVEQSGVRVGAMFIPFDTPPPASATPEDKQRALRLFSEVDQAHKKALDALDALGIPIGTCVVCFRRDLFIRDRDRTAEIDRYLEETGCELRTDTLTALPCTCQAILCHGCILHTVRDIEGLESGAIDVPCPICKEHCLLETNTLYVSNDQCGVAKKSVQHNNGLTTRVFFKDTGFSDTRGIVRFAARSATQGDTGGSDDDDDDSHIPYSPIFGPWDHWNVAEAVANDSGDDVDVPVGDADSDDGGYATPTDSETRAINSSPVRQRLRRLRRQLWRGE